MTHNFWTEFDNSDHSEPEKEGRTKRRTQTQKNILSFCPCYCLGLSQEFIEILKEAPVVAESIIA